MAVFDDFMKLDIRVGTITDAKVFEKAKKPAYKLTLDFGEDSMITAEYIPEHIGGSGERAVAPSPAKTNDSLGSTIEGIEYNTICRILKETGGNISESARMLQMSRQKLQYRIKRYHINVQKLREGLE